MHLYAAKSISQESIFGMTRGVTALAKMITDTDGRGQRNSETRYQKPDLVCNTWTSGGRNEMQEANSSNQN